MKWGERYDVSIYDIKWWYRNYAFRDVSRWKVKVYIETPDETGGFHDAICWLPDYTWEVHGYSESEMMYFKQLIRDNAHLIIEFSQEGGILNAANI